MERFIYILQEKTLDDFWRDVYESFDKKYIEDIKIIFKKKYPQNIYRIMRTI